MNNWKETSLGLLPSDWDINPLGDFLYIKGRIGWKGLKKSEYVDEGYAIINGEQIVDGKVDWPNVGRVPKERFDESPEIMLKQGDILMTKDGTIGKLAYVETLPEPATVASGVFVIREKSTLLHQLFLYYYFRSHYFEHLIKSRTEGSVIPHLYQRDFTEMEIPLPKRDEQIRIAKTLSILDKKIDNLRKQNQALETLAQTLFKHWFTDFEFPDTNGNPYKSSGGKMIDSEMGSIPSGWGVGSFLSKFKLLSGGTPDTTNSDYWNGKIKWISAKDITPNHQQYLLETDKCISQTGIDNSATKLLPSLTTIISARGTVGKFCIIPEKMCISQSNYGIRALDEGIEFYTYLVVANSVNQLKSHAYGSVFDTITTKTFKDLEIIIPPINIIKSFEQLVKSIFLKKLNNSIQIKKLTEISESLLPKLMSGQLRIK